ncbi:sigma 54-interacting response regulator [Flavihumibacter petaseus]|uniref:Putative two-component response regulator n=1 Tax=Flavihumibacter petaseus NBRC 106054 TaxID=1220578 RepID=A0A0E9N7T7_9BACT|nr:sigma 54-interacting response regulator [Flavihumibacter petaseus]GAO45420.1 putative two-component response regulator [Flavihumibacter petaseus NBRC 106054]
MQGKILIVEDQFIEALNLKVILENAGFPVCEPVQSVPEALQAIKKHHPRFVIVDIFLKGPGTGVDLGRNLMENHIPFIYLSANTNADVLEAAKKTHPYGFLVKPFREKDVLVALNIAQYLHENSFESQLFREKILSNELESIRKEGETISQILTAIAAVLQSHIPFDYFSIDWPSNEQSSIRKGLLRVGFREYQEIGPQELSNISRQALPVVDTIKLQPQRLKNAEVFSGDMETLLANQPLFRVLADSFSFRSCLVYPFNATNSQLLILYCFSRKENAFQKEHTDLLGRIEQKLHKILKTITGEVTKVQRSGGIASRPIPAENPDLIIGRSDALMKALDKLSLVAPCDASVLLYGESGTGKEKFANYLHQHSARSRQPFVKINCAAIPANLVESELFGHEKGAFTGALARRIGKFEQADGGTIFLDEIGDMPLELQVKLLRVLQENEIERIGSLHTIKVNVRIVAATNKDLEKEIAAARFRLDLYYRLNVFPIDLPPLRHRQEDIVLLARFFLQQTCAKQNKAIPSIHAAAFDELLRYHWPGNIRELQHVIERSVILCRDAEIQSFLLPSSDSYYDNQQPPLKTWEEQERDYIISVLKRCSGRISGERGAAKVMGIPATTLEYKMKKLGIKGKIS